MTNLKASNRSIYQTSDKLIAFAGDLRSDTTTKPTPAMLSAMCETIVGDDVFQDDPTVNAFESKIARLAGKEAALFCPSGTMSNQLAIRTHLKQPPYSVVCDKRAHVNNYEAGGISFHCGAQVITASPKAGFDYLTADVVQNAMILDDDIHHAPTQLVCLENTMNGCIFPMKAQEEIAAVVHKSGVMLHLDGARIWNAMAATGLSLEEITQPFDSASLCFSKGLGAPVGSVLVGNRQFIKKARHFRKLYGGGMRQIGILAAACDYSLENHFPLLLDDHRKASKLGSELVQIGYTLAKPCDTNMVWIDTSMLGPGFEAEIFSKELAKHGIASFGGQSYEIRLVVHHQISDDVIERTIKVFKFIFDLKK